MLGLNFYGHLIIMDDNRLIKKILDNGNQTEITNNKWIHIIKKNMVFLSTDQHLLRREE